MSRGNGDSVCVCVGGTNIRVHYNLSPNSHIFIPRNHGNAAMKLNFYFSVLYPEKGVKACETHWYVGSGEDPTRFTHQLPQWVSPVPALLPQLYRAGPFLCIAPVAFHTVPITSCMNYFLLLGSSASRVSKVYFQLTFHCPFVETLHVPVRHAGTIVEGLHRLVHFPVVFTFTLYSCWMGYETQLCSLQSPGLWESCVIP